MNQVGNSVFNSPFELGIRMVYLLSALFPKGGDLQKLILLDYAAIYSNDFGGPESLHTPVPYRNAELYSKRDTMQQGLKIMAAKRLVDIQLTDEGVIYYAGENARAMVDSLDSSYFNDFADRCKWVVTQYGAAEAIELTNTFTKQGCRWEAEIGRQADKKG